VGLYDSAKVTIQKAVALNPKSDWVLESKKEIEVKWTQQKTFERKVERLKDNLEKLNANPKDMKLRDSVAIYLNDIKRTEAPVHVAQRDALAVGLAAAIVGERQAATQVAEDVLRVSPEQPDAKRLKQAIKDREIEKRFPPRVPAKVQPKPQIEAKPNGKIADAPSPKPPVIDAPAPVKMDTNWRSQFIPKSSVAKDFVKWNKEQ
jgi:hypothetical protein